MGKKTAEETTEVAEKPEGELAVYDYGEDAGQGYENQTQEDRKTPLISVLQNNSPQLKPKHEKYIEGAKEGMFFNSVTGELYGDNVTFVPASTEHCYTEWVKRDDGGGFVGRHELDSDVVQKARATGKFGKLPHGANELVETFYLWCLLVKEGNDVEPALIPFTSTKIAGYKTWNTKLGMFQVVNKGRKIKPPLFANKTVLSTFPDNNKKGDFVNVRLEPANGSLVDSLLAPSDPLYQMGKKLRDMVTGGQAKADYSSQQTESGDEDSPPF